MIVSKKINESKLPMESIQFSKFLVFIMSTVQTDYKMIQTFCLLYVVSQKNVYRSMLITDLSRRVAYRICIHNVFTKNKIRYKHYIYFYFYPWLPYLIALPRSNTFGILLRNCTNWKIHSDGMGTLHSFL